MASREISSSELSSSGSFEPPSENGSTPKGTWRKSTVVAGGGHADGIAVRDDLSTSSNGGGRRDALNALNTGTGTLTVELNDFEANAARRFPSNYMRTAKYTVLTFLPKNIMEQFIRSKSNFYFLLSALISLHPDISPVSPVTTVSPLLFVLFCAAVKDGYEDWTRHKSDRLANSAQYKILRKRKGVMSIEERTSAEINVGDVVFVPKGEGFPADLVVLATSDEDGGCLVETSNLDGETNLKQRKALPATAGHYSDEGIRMLSGRVVCEPSTTDLYKFEGTLYVACDDLHGEQRLPLNAENLLLRGSRMMKPKGVYGIVVYAGEDTKMSRNLQLVSSKFSSIQRKLNSTVLIILLFNVVLVLSCSIFAGIFQHTTVANLPYMGDVRWEEPLTVAGTSLLTYFVLFTYLIPISLFVTLEIVRITQAGFMMMDSTMAGDPTKLLETGMVVRNSNMNEELGRVEHIFSDKTGTLTCNEMRLLRWSINGVLYDHTLTMVDRPIPIRFPVPRAPPHNEGIQLDFLRAVCLCNTVMPEVLENGEIEYQAESPDEGAFVKCAAQCGVELRSRKGKRVELAVNGKTEVYEVLVVLAFSSARQRMSVIVRYPDASLWLICKGADAAILGRLGKKDPLAPITLRHVDAAAREGLRTLLVAVSHLSEKRYQHWKVLHDNVAASVGLGRQARLAAAYEEMENNLFLLGATAVEDRLQDKVPQTISTLLLAGLRIWVLTGDKLETAENIGYSSSLLRPGVNLVRLVLSPDKVAAAAAPPLMQQLMDAIDNIPTNAPPSDHAVIIDGFTLRVALESTELSTVFLQLTALCQTVVCCRVSPKQKADVVSLVKKAHRRICLAIGDGANDVSMIQMADVGVGIVGKEGTQAERASDYAIGEFRFLAPLLLVHGRWATRRTSTLILYSFYKNIAFIWPLFLFGVYSAFSGQVLYDEVVLAAFNILWTSLPPFVMGIWDRDVPRDVLERHPELHHEFLANDVYAWRMVAEWLVLGLFHGTVVFNLSYLASGQFDVIESNGQVGGLMFKAAMVGTVGITVVLAKAALTFKHWVMFTHIALWGTVVAYIVFLLVYMGVAWFGAYTYGAAVKNFSSPTFWFTLPLALVVCLLPDVVMEAVRTNWYPTMWQQRVLQNKRRPATIAPACDTPPEEAVVEADR